MRHLDLRHVSSIGFGPSRAAGPGRRHRVRWTLALCAVPFAVPLVGGCAGGEALRDGERRSGDDREGSEFLLMEVATVGMDLRTGAPLALLHANWEHVVPIWIGDPEAQAIARARGNVPVPRPQTHDLFASVLETLQGTLEEVRVHDLREGTYFGVLRIRARGELRQVDARPSDALALAVRTGARILVAEKLVDDDPDVDFLSADGERAIARIRGMTVSAPSEEERVRFGIAPDRSGVLVLHAPPALGERGVRRGDLIVAVDGRGIDSAFDFLEAMATRPSDVPVQVRFLRGDEVLEAEIAPRRPTQVT